MSSALNVPIVPPAAVEFWGATFSHDGNALYYVVWDRAHADAELYELPALGGTAKKLVSGIELYRDVWAYAQPRRSLSARGRLTRLPIG